MISINRSVAAYKDTGLAFVSALLLFLSFPKFDYYPLAWIALVPLLVALDGKSLGRAFALSFLTGMVFLMGVFFWINVIDGFTLMDFLLLGVVLGSYYGLFGVLLNFTSQALSIPAAYVAPMIWVVMEYARAQLGDLSLPWAFLGHSQYLNLPMIQLASFTGAYGISYLIVMANGALADLIHAGIHRTEDEHRRLMRSAIRAGIITLTVFVSSLVYGLAMLKTSLDSPMMRIAVIQGNIPQADRWLPRFQNQHLEKHLQLTREVVKDSQPELIVWPETAVRGSVAENRRLAGVFAELAQEANAFLIIGSAERAKFAKTSSQSEPVWNSAFLFSPDAKIVGRYDKIRLFPFGEYLPYKNLPWPRRISSLWTSQGYTSGTNFSVFDTGKAKLAVTICWENIFPNLVREFVRNGASVVVNLTNEAWFGDTAAPYQLLSMSVFRAVENRVTVIRAANTGVSGFIDPFGRILGTIKSGSKEVMVEGYLTRQIALSFQRTFYTAYGDIFVWACVVSSLLFLLVSISRVNLQRK